MLIDVLKGRPEAVEAVKACGKGVLTTEINRFEVLFGIYLRNGARKERELAAAQGLFNSLEVLPFEQSADDAAQILAGLSKEGQIIEQNDALIAATMLAHGCHTILTRNSKHFSRVSELTVRTY